MILKLLGLSIKSGKVKEEETEVSVLADNQMWYYQKSNIPKKDQNESPQKPKRLSKLDEIKHF